MTKLYRKTYAEIDLNNLKYNVNYLVNKLNNYQHHIAVVKADCYSHYDIKTINAIISGGINFLAVATIEEAINIRKYNKKIPILCLGYVYSEDIKFCAKNNISVTINSLETALSIKNYKNLKVHIKLNTNMNRLGINNTKDFDETIKILNTKNIFIEGIYTHVYNDKSKKDTLNQVDLFKKITQNYDLTKVPFVHMGASNFCLNYDKPEFVNTARFGIAMYGLENKDLKSTFSLYSHIIQINEVDGTVGYGARYKTNGKELIAVVPIGYADGIIRANTGRYVYINNKKYPIVGNICMDMLFVKVDKSVKLNDQVVLIKDNNHINYIAKYLNTISYEVICSVGKRIPRIYK